MHSFDLIPIGEKFFIDLIIQMLIFFQVHRNNLPIHWDLNHKPKYSFLFKADGCYGCFGQDQVLLGEKQSWLLVNDRCSK